MRTLMVAFVLVAGAFANTGCERATGIYVRELRVDGTPWAWVVQTPYDSKNHEETYKPFVHLLDPISNLPITKGVGGIDSHHRGMYIGWNEVHTSGAVYDFWHMTDGVSQRHVEWMPVNEPEEGAAERQRIHWCDPDGNPLIEEIRTIYAHPGPEGIRLVDFESELTSLDGSIQLRGDLHHAGMHVRLANAVFWTQWRTRYTFPEGVSRQLNARVPNAWWVCCSAVVQGRRFWILHMTYPADHPVAPTYSARQYARFGAFFETELEFHQPVIFRFRIALALEPLDVARCEALFAEYAEVGS